MKSVEKKVVDEYVTALYRLLLRRQPDEGGFQAWRGLFSDAGLGGFSQAIEGFVESSEFKNLYISPHSTSLEEFREFDFSALGMDVLNALFEKTSSYWRGSASSPEEIYWSVLTDDHYRGVLSEDVIAEFLSTGKGDISRIKKICKEIDFEFDACGEFLEYGCGVGRLVVNLPDSIKKVNCVDFSSAHLAEAEANLRRLKPQVICSMHKIESVYDLCKLPQNQDMVHSLIVLQHNTPPVIEKTVDSLLRLLAPGGIAILHIPIAKASYQFDVQAYLGDNRSGQSMEMHILPKANICRVARGAGCEIVYSYCDRGCGGDIYSEMLVFRRV